MRYLRGAKVEIDMRRKPVRECSLSGCRDFQVIKGYCRNHYVVARCQEIKVQLIQEFGAACNNKQGCPFNVSWPKHPPEIFDFDHLGLKKLHPHQAFHYSWDTISREFTNIQMLCKNCHSISTTDRVRKERFG